jgi:hypothetical protein
MSQLLQDLRKQVSLLQNPLKEVTVVSNSSSHLKFDLPRPLTRLQTRRALNNLAEFYLMGADSPATLLKPLLSGMECTLQASVTHVQ